MTDFSAGDILEWQGCPVLVLGPSKKYDRKGHRTATYLAVFGSNFAVRAGDILPGFKITNKERWTKPLTEQQTILYTKMMLLHAS